MFNKKANKLYTPDENYIKWEAALKHRDELIEAINDALDAGEVVDDLGDELNIAQMEEDRLRRLL